MVSDAIVRSFDEVVHGRYFVPTAYPVPLTPYPVLRTAHLPTSSHMDASDEAQHLNSTEPQRSRKTSRFSSGTYVYVVSSEW